MNRFLSRPELDPLLLGSPLRRRGYAIAVVAVLAVVLLFAILMNLLAIGGLKPDVAQVFFLALGAAALASLVPLAILRYLDRREHESKWLFACAILWGALIATGLALPLNNAILREISRWVRANPDVGQALGPMAALLIGAPIAGPLVEETTKGLGVLLLFLLLRAEFDNMRDGLIYGALVGVGFNLLEAPLYVAQNYAEFGFAPWGFQLGSRFALFGLGSHALYTGLFGGFLGLARQMAPGWKQYVVPIIGLLLAILAHALNNALGLIVIIAGVAPPPTEDVAPPNISFLVAWLGASVRTLIVFFPILALMAVLLWRSGRWERRVIGEELAGEVGGAVTPAEYEQVKRDGMFHTRRIDTLDRRRSAALVNAQHELAFRKRRVRLLGEDPERDPLVESWRGAIARLRSSV
jgi:RsiW-degrading membrane proteinase PrsW (M82 family)